MGSIWKLWNNISLIRRITGGLIIGVILALISPGLGWPAVMGGFFVSALKAVAPVLVFFLVINSLCHAGKAGGMKRIILLYACSTFIAGLMAAAASFVFPVTMTLAGVEAAKNAAPSGVGEVMANLLSKLVSNPVGSLTEANFLGILAWAVLLGISLRGAGEHTKDFFHDIAASVQKVVTWIIAFAPFGVFGLVHEAVATSGLGIFREYGLLLFVLVSVMLLVAFVGNPLLVWLNIRRNPYPLVLRTLKDSAVMAFFTRSSAANIPVNMELCKRLGLNRDTYAVSIPLGATINMAGACVTITVMSLAAAHTVGESVDFFSGVVLCALSTVAACGASGVPGGSLLLIPVACSLLGLPADISMQVVGVGFIIGVIQDSCETALNSSSDVLFTATTEYAQMAKKGIPFTPGADAPQAETGRG